MCIGKKCIYEVLSKYSRIIHGKFEYFGDFLFVAGFSGIKEKTVHK
jgi:hypothetical protein